MKEPNSQGSSESMIELFRRETESQAAILTQGLLGLENQPHGAELLETLMRAAHSLKGAARIVGFEAAVRVAHAMEDWFVLAQRGRIRLGQPEVDSLFCGVDLLLQIAKQPEQDIAAWERVHASEINAFVSAAPGGATLATDPEEAPQPAGLLPSDTRIHPGDGASLSLVSNQEAPERVVRLAAENLNRLLGLAGEALVESRWLRPFAASLQRLKRHHLELSQKLDNLQGAVASGGASPRAEHHFADLSRALQTSELLLNERLEEIDAFDRRSSQLSQRLYLEVLRMRMRPFSDGVGRFPRMVRDLARALKKEVRLEITGDNTPVDRDILERLESPLAHLLRNAVDHGCEAPEQRQLLGKPPHGTIRLDARHSAGMLVVTVTDDGPGVELDRVREVALQKNLVTTTVAEKLTEPELLQLLVAPGFTLKQGVTDISGRGVGLDVVQNMVRNVRGSLRVTTKPGQGLRIQLQLPLTLSVLRALLVEISGEPYAFPLSQIRHTLAISQSSISRAATTPRFRFGGQEIGLMGADEVLECGPPHPPKTDLPVVVLGNTSPYGLVVDRFLGERELVVQPLDPRLGKVRDISAAALMEDGSPVLIVDVDEMLESMARIVSQQASGSRRPKSLQPIATKRKTVLAVDDSLSVRELLRKLLTHRGYQVEVAVDGMEGWNAVHTRHYDLVITDIDMPGMDGIHLATLIKSDSRLRSMPVMVVSYKDSREDRLRGLEAGADYYLTKAGFHDNTLLQAVVDLIGEPEA